MRMPWRRTKQLPSANSAEERVGRFQAEYEARWRDAEILHASAEERGEVFDVFFPKWKEMMAQTTRTHFTENSRSSFGGGFSSRPEHGSTVEEYVRSESHGDTTYVLYKNVGGMFGKFHEYVVHASDGDFKIFDVAVHYSDPALPFVEASAIAERQSECAVDAALAALPDDELLLDQNRNFTQRQVRNDDGETAETEVRQVGELITRSGVLTVWDFGCDNDDTRPLARTVAPGAYPIDRVTAFGRNAAVRVRFSDATPVSWRLADRVGGGSDTVGVDAGCICIADFGAYASMTPRAKTVSFESINHVARPAVLPFPLGESNVGFACDSGWGDGSYPVYWGLDEHEQIAQLVVDFSVLVRKEDGQYTHL